MEFAQINGDIDELVVQIRELEVKFRLLCGKDEQLG